MRQLWKTNYYVEYSEYSRRTVRWYMQLFKGEAHSGDLEGRAEQSKAEQNMPTAES